MTKSAVAMMFFCYKKQLQNVEKVHYLKNNQATVKTKQKMTCLHFYAKFVGLQKQRVTKYLCSVFGDSSFYDELDLIIGLWFVVCGCLDYKILLAVFLTKYLIDFFAISIKPILLL
jgi:hypothetical protein